MKRREFIAATAALLVLPRRLCAQGMPRRIGVLSPTPTDDPVHGAWLSGLREKGWIEGKNLLVETRYALPWRSASSKACRVQAAT